jgi:hypothetical protein
MYSCEPDEVNPSVQMPDIAHEILRLQSELGDLWQEYIEVAELSGFVDSEKPHEENFAILESTMMAVAERGPYSALRTQSEGVNWADENGLPQRMHYRKDGVVEYTYDSGETFLSNE